MQGGSESVKQIFFMNHLLAGNIHSIISFLLGGYVSSLTSANSVTMTFSHLGKMFRVTETTTWVGLANILLTDSLNPTGQLFLSNWLTDKIDLNLSSKILSTSKAIIYK